MANQNPSFENFKDDLESIHEDLVDVLSRVSDVKDQELGPVIKQADGDNDDIMRELELLVDRVINKSEMLTAESQRLSEYFLTFQ